MKDEEMAEEINITYENNVFYCTKNGTNWISVDGEKWYGEEKRIAELENKIADIKANCDLAIEGRDIKIVELTKQIEKMRKKDELKKVASVWNYLRTVGAETRIAELEKENAELKNKLEHRNCLDCSNHSSKLRMRTLDLEKENAELKSENQKWKDEWQEQVQKATDEGYARTLQTMQLTKAKEVLRNLLSAYITYADSFDDRDNEIVEEAVQILNSEVEK